MVLCEELFHSPSGVAFADFITEGHRETWPIRRKTFPKLAAALLLRKRNYADCAAIRAI